ncbi:transposase [Phormidium sp. FACHB-592]|nr:transposase [Phormidium sp. FACHB-592]
MDEAMLEQWVIPNFSGKSGALDFHSDLAICTMTMLKAVYKLAGRQCQEFLESILELMEIDLPVLDHST